MDVGTAEIGFVLISYDSKRENPMDDFNDSFDEWDVSEEEGNLSEEQYRQRLKKSNSIAIYSVLGIVGVVVIVIAVIASTGMFVSKGRYPGGKQVGDVIYPEGFEEKMDSLSRKSSRTPDENKESREIVPLDDPVKKELDVLFEKFLNAAKTKNKSTLAECFDFEEMLSKVNRKSMQQNIDGSFLVKDSQKIRDGFLDGFLEDESYRQVSKIEISRIYRVGSSDRFQVYADMHISDDFVKLEFLVRRKESEIRIFNLGNMMLGTDSVSVMSDLMFLASRGKRFLTQGEANILLLVKTLETIDREEWNDAEKNLENFDKNFSSKHIDASYFQLKATIAIQKEEYENALIHCKRIEELLGETPPFVHALLSVSHRMQGRFDEALNSAQHYTDEFGDDNLGLTQLALAQFSKGHKTQAVQTARKGLEKYPNSPSLVYLVGSSEDGASKKEFVLFLSKMKQNENNYRALCDLFVDDNNFKSVRTALEQFGKKHPEHPYIPFYRAKELFEQEKYRTAVETLKPILSQVRTREDFWDFEELYIDSLYNFDESQAIDAYAISKIPKKTFAYISLGLLRDESFDNLRRLCELHKKKVPNDPAIRRFEGELAIHEKYWAKAVEELRFAYKAEKNEKEKASLRNRIFEVAYRLEDVTDLYNKWDDKEQFFRGVASQFRVYHDPLRLQKLVNLHRNQSRRRLSTYYDGLISSAERDFKKMTRYMQTEYAFYRDEKDKKKARELYLDAILRLGKIEEAYENSRDTDEIIFYLGRKLIVKKDIAGLEKLIAVNREYHTYFEWSEYYEGNLAELSDNWEKAIGFYRKGYLESTDSSVYRDDLVNALNEAKRPMEAYYLVKEKKETFSELASKMSRDNHWIALKTLIETHKRNYPTDSKIVKFEAINLMANHRFSDAMILLLPHIERDTKQSKSLRLPSLYAEAAVGAGKTVEVYRERKSTNSIYVSLISQLFRQTEYDIIPDLVEEHRKNNPHYPWLESHLGRAEERKKEWTKAVGHYRKGLTTASPKNKAYYRTQLVRAEFFAGNALELLEEFSQDRAVYEQLAKLAYREKSMENDETIDFLEKLIERWKKDAPEDHPLTLYWTAAIHLLKSENVEAAKILQTHFQKLVEDETNASAVESDLVYALLREKDFDQAKKYAMLGYRRIGDPWLPTLTAIASEDVDEAISWTYDLLEYRRTLKQLYDEKLVSDVLRSKAFAKYRKKYPPPKRVLSIAP